MRPQPDKSGYHEEMELRRREGAPGLRTDIRMGDNEQIDDMIDDDLEDDGIRVERELGRTDEPDVRRDRDRKKRLDDDADMDDDLGSEQQDRRKMPSQRKA